MKSEPQLKELDFTAAGKEIYDMIVDLFPICRSITGDGVRKTLQKIKEKIPLEIHEVPTGTKVFDWTVPKEWNIKDAFIKDPNGKKVVDFKESNLHVISYSVPVVRKISLDELKNHLFTLPEYPDWIPYKTSYYDEKWGFCISHNQSLSLQDGDYEVCIESELADGYLTYGEYLVKGELSDEVLLSTHICHPSMANDNLSGVCTAAMLAKYLSGQKLKMSYRILFIPGTIGAISWLALNQEALRKIKHGLVLTGLGDPGIITYKKSRVGNAEIDRIVQYALSCCGKKHNIIEFSPYGYDERQYCSPGMNLPVGRLSRTPFGEYPQYHTSADNLNFIQSSALANSIELMFRILAIVETNAFYVNTIPMCEPQLGRRGLYRQIGDKELAMLWVLNLSDGAHSLLDITQRSGVPYNSILSATHLLCEHGLLKILQNK